MLKMIYLKIAIKPPFSSNLIFIYYISCFKKFHGILLARILEWVAVPFSRDLHNPRIEPRSAMLQADSLISFIREAVHLYTSRYFVGVWGASLVAQRIKHLPAMQETRFDPWVVKIPWRRKWQPIPVFSPGESHGQRSLEGYSPQGRKESNMTERLHFTSLQAFFLCTHTFV